ncbi:MAG: hypothetical protein Q7U57_16315 [Methylovulum sp.]|nr:hypothetical protein [Methylovulum sp.]
MRPTVENSNLERNGISKEVVALVSRLIDLIPGPGRRCALGDVTLSLLDGKHRVAEDVLGWKRSTVEVPYSHLIEKTSKF